jgi:cardiolipin synthase
MTNPACGARAAILHSLTRSLVGVVLLAAAGCAGVPDVDDSLAKVNAAAAEPAIVGADGTMSARQSAAVLDDVADDAGQLELLARHRAVEEAVAGSPLTAGNKTKLLRDGDGTFAGVFEAIRAAKHHVNLEYYTLEDVNQEGELLSDLLIAKRQAGVAVNVIYDSYGSNETPVEFFEGLAAAGVNVLEFHPTNPLDAVAGGYSPNDRNHRKIMVVDGAIGIVGGVNLASYYQSKTPGSDSSGEPAEPEEQAGAGEQAEAGDGAVPPADSMPETWRDLSLRIEGPAVAQLQRLFLGHWRSGGGKPLDQTGFFPDLPVRDGEVVRIIGSSPEQEISRYYVTLISAIRSAERRVWLTTAYFVPTDDELDTLEDAAERGVDVRLMLPADSDAGEAVAIARSHYADLLEEGVRIFEVSGVVLHSKTVTIDGVWSAVGSSNFDHRSVLFNDEVDAIVLSADVARDLQKRFVEDLAVAKEITRAAWSDRPLIERIGDVFHRPWQPLF